MKLAYIAPYDFTQPKAHTIQIVQMCQHFAVIGVEVVLYIPIDFQLTNEILFSVYGINSKFSIKKINISINQWAWKRRFAFLAMLESKRNGVDFIYSRSIHPCFFAHYLKIPFVFECHTPDLDSGRLTRFAWQKAISSKYLKAWITISKSLYYYYLARNFQHKKIILYEPGGVDRCSYEKTTTENTRPILTYVGSLYQGKGVEFVLRLAKHLPQYIFNIVGGQQSEFEIITSREGLSVNVIYKQFCSPQDVAYEFQNSDILIAPYDFSVFDSSGKNIAFWFSPLKLFEYMGSGKPCIISQLPQITELVTNNEVWFAEANSIESWTDVISQVLSNKAKAEEMRERALNFVTNRYLWSERAKRIVDFMQNK